MSIYVMRCPDTAGGGAAPAAADEPAQQPADKPAEPKTEYTAKEWRELNAKYNLSVTDLNVRVSGTASGGFGILTDDVVRRMLSDTCVFLHQVVALTSGALGGFTAAHLREIVGHEIAIPAGIIRGDDKVSMNETPPKAEQAPDRDGRKNPRGRKHPLVALIELAAKAAKLLDKITAGLKPHVHNIESLESRVQARADALDQRREASTNTLFR